MSPSDEDMDWLAARVRDHARYADQLRAIHQAGGNAITHWALTVANERCEEAIKIWERFTGGGWVD